MLSFKQVLVGFNIRLFCYTIYIKASNIISVRVMSFQSSISREVFTINIDVEFTSILLHILVL